MNNYYTYILLNGQYTNIDNKQDRRYKKLIETIILTENFFLLEDNELGIILVNHINIDSVKNYKEEINKTGIIHFMVPIKYFDGTLIKKYHFNKKETR